MSEHRAAPLIAAKMSVPPVRAGAVPRLRLHPARTDHSTPRLTVVVAPAGWGKTTLLSQWAHEASETRDVVWVSLDEADDDPVRFWSYVLTVQQDIDGLTAAPMSAVLTPGLQPVMGGVSRAEVEVAFPGWEMLSVEPADTMGLGWPLTKTAPQWYRLRRQA